MSVLAASKRLRGKTILITGASSGIGKSCAMQFAMMSPGDLKLILTARRIDVLKQIAEEINKEVGQGVKILPVQLDVADPEAIKAFARDLREKEEWREWREVDVLVNNAGLVHGVDQAPNIKEADIQTMFNTNVHGLINMTQAILPIFKARDSEQYPGGVGDIIQIGSIAGRTGYPGGSIYCATKSAIRTFTEALRHELTSTRIRIMEVDPGQVETEFSVVRFGGDREKAKKVYEGVEPLTPDDVAEVVVFMVGRRENVVVADVLVFPSHQASATSMFRRGT